MSVKRKVLVGIGTLVAVFIAWIVTLLLAGVVVQSRVPVSLPPSMHVFSIGDEYVIADGTWVIEGDKQAFPLQTTHIRCEKRLARCTAATAQVMSGEQMHVDVGFHEVAEWGSSRVVFVDDSPTCVRYVYTIDLLTESGNAVRQRRDTPRTSGARCEGLERQLRLTLKRGFDVWWALQQEATPWFGRMAQAPLKLIF